MNFNYLHFPRDLMFILVIRHFVLAVRCLETAKGEGDEQEGAHERQVPGKQVKHHLARVMAHAGQVLVDGAEVAAHALFVAVVEGV